MQALTGLLGAEDEMQAESERQGRQRYKSLQLENAAVRKVLQRMKAYAQVHDDGERMPTATADALGKRITELRSLLHEEA